MHFPDVALASIGVTIPQAQWTSEQIEKDLQPLYSRLKLPEGRLAMMSGIESRRVWEPGTVPSGPSIQSGRHAIDAASIAPDQIGALIHASVCRDFLEPATASRVHHELGLSPNCWVYDVSNACLGVLNGAVQIATMIQSGMISAGIVVGTENSRPLMEATIASLNADTQLTRKTVKPAFASLTIGSGSCAWLLTHHDLHPNATTLEHGIARAHTAHHALCRSDQDTAGAGMQPLMETDSETLMAEGIATGVAALDDLLQQSGWSRDQINRSICHQVGSRHRVGMLEAMQLPVDRDSVTFPALGNTGSVALPLTVAAAAATGDLSPQDHTAMLGIGSGINSVMIGAKWGETAIAGDWAGLLDELAPSRLAASAH
ncbi:3-oxoacyl-[ACP] synthase III in alkane synthesis cluster [Rhodopirellula islandica]|uniref:3-oxoacyl-[ACP] synthase III in alkane synthesis cluster n=1 Tax=Rhodopirellula islandica TaxID=595434 RepID=A0A0J1EHT0_RHOIS|nr:3-oxoacyl-ACP synthase III [Rhodopirellula islandica]KLU05104.1 3-oxoacyl-[ACP] synthase III in alkane synthesis cluster [Rhodopirellula islandica]